MERKEILTDKQKLKFVEILLIVGSILSAFNLPLEMVWVFMLFILFSLLYYVYLQRNDKNVKTFNYFAIFVSGYFSGVYTYLFSVSLLTVTIHYYPYTVSIPILYYSVLTWTFYKVLSKPIKRGKINMWERFKKYYRPCALLGFIFVGIGILFVGLAVYVFITNNEEMRWSDILAIGLALISFGIALISLCISRESTRRLERVTDSDYDNFIDLMENTRISFIDEARIRGIDRFMVEVVAWKSRQYFDRAINLREWVIDKSKLRDLSTYLKHLVHLLLYQSQSEEKKWISLVWNRDVGNIVKMYHKLWDTKMIDYADEKVRKELIYIFENFIGNRLPQESDLALFERIQTALSEKDANKPFEKITFENKSKAK